MTGDTSSEIYDNPVPHMTVEGIFRYVGIDRIPVSRTDDGGNSPSSFSGEVIE